MLEVGHAREAEKGGDEDPRLHDEERAGDGGPPPARLERRQAIGDGIEGRLLLERAPEALAGDADDEESGDER